MTVNIRFGIQQRVQRLLTVPGIPDPASSIWISCPIGVSSLIGRSFILEEAALPESAKDSVRCLALHGMHVVIRLFIIP
jgi:hypothetical protein